MACITDNAHSNDSLKKCIRVYNTSDNFHGLTFLARANVLDNVVLNR